MIIDGRVYEVGEHVINGERIRVIDRSTYISLGKVESTVKTSVESDGININTADVDELTLLNGVGKAGAKRIIKHRPFTSIDDLARVGGIGQKIIDKNAGVITL